MTDMKNTQRVLWGIGTPRTMRAHWALREPFHSPALNGLLASHMRTAAVLSCLGVGFEARNAPGATPAPAGGRFVSESY